MVAPEPAPSAAPRVVDVCTEGREVVEPAIRVDVGEVDDLPPGACIGEVAGDCPTPMAPVGLDWPLPLRPTAPPAPTARRTTTMAADSRTSRDGPVALRALDQKPLLCAGT